MESEVNRQDESDAEEERAVKPAEVLVFVGRSARRHRLLGLVLALCVAAIGTVLSTVVPLKYDAESRILVVKLKTLGVLVNPERFSSNTDVLAGATERLVQKSNLLQMVREAKLLERWDATRPAILRAKDKLVPLVTGTAVNENDKVEALVKLLQSSLQVSHDETIMQIRATWRDPESAWTLAKLAQTSFLDARHQQERLEVTTAMSVVEAEVKTAAEAIDPALEEVVRANEQRAARTQQNRRAAAGAAAPVAATVTRIVRTPALSASSGSGSGESPTSKLTTRLADLRQQIRDVETPWQRRLAELKLQMVDMRGTYGPEHPAMLQQQAKIHEAEVEPSELVSLRREEKRLLADIESAAANAVASAPRTTMTVVQQPAGGGSDSSLADPPLSALGPRTLRDALLAAEREEDPVVAAAQAKLTAALNKYNEATKKLDAARVELATLQAAFPYRYVVVTEPERPLKPLKPLRLIVLAGALVAAALVGLLAGAIRDLLSGRIMEPWQVRTLGIPLLGQADLARKRLP